VVVIKLDYLEAQPTIAKEAGRNTKEQKTAKTISMSLSFWALVQQIQTQKGFKDYKEAIYFGVYNTAKDLGIES
jgi:hypothetical protein